jgi:hypothetical protein
MATTAICRRRSMTEDQRAAQVEDLKRHLGID